MASEEIGNQWCWCWAATALLLVMLLLISSRMRFVVKVSFYLTCLLIAGTVGGIVSLPYGRTPDNHWRVFTIFQWLCAVLRLRFVLRNRHYIDSDKPFIIIANHQSALDVLGMTYCWPKNCVVMLKSSLKYLPGFNICAYLCNAIFINRFSKEEAHKALDSTLYAIKKYKRKVWVYPEGTRNPGKVMLPFRKGAFVLSIQAKANQKFDSGECLVEFLPPIDPSNFDDVLELSDYCRNIMMAKFEELNEELGNTLYLKDK